MQRVEGKIVGVAQAENGHVTSVTLDNDREIEGELFVECSGFRGLLIEETLHAGYEDWSPWLPCDRAVACPSTNGGDPVPYTRATARAAGWQWRIPLQHRTGNGHVYSSAHTDKDAATALLLANLAGDQLAEPRYLSFKASRRREAWNANVVAIGLAAGFLEPLESTSIHLIQSGISKLLALFPDARFAAIERDEYNRLMKAAYDGVRDFIILHYHATTRTDTPFWNHVRTMAVPDSLHRKLELFRSKGRVFSYDDELFSVTSWSRCCLARASPRSTTTPCRRARRPPRPDRDGRNGHRYRPHRRRHAHPSRLHCRALQGGGGLLGPAGLPQLVAQLPDHKAQQHLLALGRGLARHRLPAFGQMRARLCRVLIEDEMLEERAPRFALGARLIA